MPTQDNLGAFHSGNAIKTEKKQGMSAQEALAAEKRNLTDMPTHTRGEMTKKEALAVAWTGIEALAFLKQAKIYRSPKTHRVVIELLEVDYDTANGLQSVGK